MHDLLFSEQRKLDDKALMGRAAAANLDASVFAACLNGPELSQISEDIAAAKALAISGTPTVLVGTALGDGTVRVRKRVQGAQGLKAVSAVIDEVLAAASR